MRDAMIAFNPLLSPDRPTQPIEVDEVVCGLLRTVRAFVDTMPASAWHRTLEGLVRKLELEVARWRAVAPTSEQRAAMLEVISDLEVAVRGGAAMNHPLER